MLLAKFSTTFDLHVMHNNPTFLPSRYFKEQRTLTSAILFTFDRMRNAVRACAPDIKT